MRLKYTKEQERELIDNYVVIETHDDREIFILKYMAKHEKNKRSVVAKLSKLGIYVSRPRTSKVLGTKPQTKEQLLQSISNKLGCDILKLEGIDLSPKLSLKNLLEAITELTS